MPKITVPGQRYSVVDCSVRGKPVPLAEAPSPDEKPDRLDIDIFQLRCPEMRLCGTYAPRQMSRRLVEHMPGDRFRAHNPLSFRRNWQG